LRKEWRSAQALHIGRDVVRRGEYHLQVGKIGEECIAEGKAIQRGEINFRDQQVASAIGVDPLDDGIRVRCHSGSGFAKCGEGL
jgi:hypothetical protein